MIRDLLIPNCGYPIACVDGTPLTSAWRGAANDLTRPLGRPLVGGTRVVSAAENRGT